MNCLPLPDEILRCIYQFINPIFEYENYIKTMRSSNDLTLDLSIQLNETYNILYRGSAEYKLTCFEALSANSSLQTEYLREINKFLKKNPKFVRGMTSDMLCGFYYKRQFDPEISVRNMKRLDFNRSVERGLWEYPDTDRELLYFHDIVEVLQNGSLRDLIYACIVNRVEGFKNTLQKCREIKIRSEKDIVRLIDRNYLSSNTGAANSKKCLRLPSRKSLVQKLMKL